MMKIRDYTDKLTWEELQEIFSNFEELEKKTAIGDCLLRSLTEKIFNETDLHSSVIILSMNLVALDCYRLVAEKAIENGFGKFYKSKGL